MVEQSSKTDSIFWSALAIAAPQERDRYLDAACADDPNLRAQLDELLAAYPKVERFLEQPAFPADATGLHGPTIAERPGTIIGPYKLLQLIGEGGMGVVFMAEQEHPVRRKVALKIIKPGMDSRQVIARFEAERQALALMDHPNIAKVLDAGTTDAGRPYFVMELVKGMPITQYCDEHRLTPRLRLELFIPVCQAVQHAHQKGIIHRDLKPTNVLVADYDDRPVVKIIDFGVAKAVGQPLTERTMFTQLGQVVGTVEYMSPEQARFNQLDVDTRSDVYSLGVLLYEVLTGSTPLEKARLHAAAFDEMLRIICEEEPPRPSLRLTSSQSLPSISAQRQIEPAKLKKLVRGELDWIVMKCLEKDRNRRYETASALAIDLQHYLSDEPVEARQATRMYRLKKFVRRNKVGALTGLAIVAALLLGLTLASIGFIQARRQAVIARTQAARSDQVAQFLKDMLQGVGPSVAEGRDTTMLREIVDKTASRVSTDLVEQPEVEIELRMTLGEVYSQLQLYKKMEQMARGTLRLARAHFGTESVAVADSLAQLGDALLRLHSLDEAATVAREAVLINRRLRGDESLQEADALCVLGAILHGDINPDAELKSIPDDNARLKESEDVIRKAVTIQRSKLGDADLAVAVSLDALGLTLCQLNKLEESETAYRQALTIRQKHFGGDEHSEMTRSFVWLGYALAAQGKLDAAESYVRKAIPIQRKTQGAGKWYQAVSRWVLADILQRKGEFAEAESHLRESVAIGRSEMGRDHPFLPKLILCLSRVLYELNGDQEATELVNEAVALCRSHLDWDPSATNALAELIRNLLSHGRAANAELPAREYLAIREERLPDTWRTFDARSMLGECLLAQKKYEEAEPLLLSGYKGLQRWHKSIPPIASARQSEALQRLIRLYDATNQPDEAANWRRVAAKVGSETDSVTAASQAASRSSPVPQP